MTPATWLPDPSHYPEQLTPLSATVWFEAVGRGLHEAMRELRGPFAGFEARTERGWAYEGDLAPEWEVDPEGLRRAALGLSARWDAELRPLAHAITGSLHAARPEDPPPEGAAHLLDRCWDLILDQWTIHFLAVVPAQAAIELLTDAHREVFGHRDPLAPYRLLDGLPNESTEADGWLRRLAALAGALGVDDVLRGYPSETVLERLRELRNGRSWLRELDGYLARFGGRARWHELSLPREVERPTMTLASIRLFLESGTTLRPDPAATGHHLEQEALGRAPELATVLPAARFGYALKETHAYHIDYPGLLATREMLLGFGRRLVAEGRLEALEDVWMLRREELRAAVTDPGMALDGVVAAARDDLAEGFREGPKPYLGASPPDVERHPTLERFYGRAGGSTETSVRGTGASPGVADGPARVVAGVGDFARVRPGDVLVTTTTTPAWTPLFPSIAALVTETGGILSHAAIVAREYGLPTVVGATGATRRIPDGAPVRVDGDAGEVSFGQRSDRPGSKDPSARPVS